MRKIAKLVGVFAFVSAGMSTISPNARAECWGERCAIDHGGSFPPGSGGGTLPTSWGGCKLANTAEAELARDCPMP